ncbi:MAG: CBS domain-containing protein, partial [Novosphingobium sp.]|nr:CBS domain-containing protein [Novosphingobium sp.]
LMGLLSRDGIIRALAEGGPDSPIADFIDADVPTVSRWTRMDDILPLLAGGAPAVIVTDDAGRCLGYITLQNLIEELHISRALSQSGAMRKHGEAR